MRNGKPDYGGSWRFRIFEKGIDRILTDDVLELFFNHVREIRQDAVRGNKRIYIGPDNFTPLGRDKIPVDCKVDPVKTDVNTPPQWERTYKMTIKVQWKEDSLSLIHI